ncbi:aldo/keto reductase [Desulfitibacter alkalitolerans]|uniref:aldo/keto reductase n=1 Tax=Desulfitibacter alkalitolerans TaxID=264641 RepID=UPI0004823E4B|nr:aldo/keto reductase [Desulfitibacter alkalitolerans]
MEYKKLGLADITVSELCFGLLPMGPIQANISSQEGGALIRHALEMGINFIDTAELYGTYEHILRGTHGFPREVVIASKSAASDYKGMEDAIQGALKALKRDAIDIFHLHAARADTDVFNERGDALQCILDYKQKGHVRATGIATHNVKVAELASTVPEIDIVHPLINKSSRGIVNGTAADMAKAIEKCHAAGKGLYAMKALAGGNLVGELLEAVSFVRNTKGIHSIAVGMIRKEELELNLKIFNGDVITFDMLSKLKNTKKIFVRDSLCEKCCICIDACPNSALHLGNENIEVDHGKCILCGYCYPACPQFAIRLI